MLADVKLESNGSVISKRVLFETTIYLNSSLNPNTLYNMSCKNF
jgi:hypothetical protein